VKPVRESAIERKVVLWAKKNGVLTMKIRGERGWPDRLFIRNGAVIFVEFKATRGRLSLLQHTRLDDLHREGVRAIMMKDADRCIEILKRVLV
jgi:hypothetical protein